VNGDCQSFGEGSCSNTTWENAVQIAPGVPGMAMHYNVTATGGIGTAGNAPAGVGQNAYANPADVYAKFRRLVLGIDTNAGGTGVIRGFNRWNLDVSINKDTQFTERVGANFYVLITNFLNHFQPSDPSTSLDNQSTANTPTRFGLITGQATGYDSRQMEFGLRIRW